MVMKKTEEQVSVMLADTIVALCRNTLPYVGHVSVEGLLGITLDNKEIFLVNINQKIDRDGESNNVKKRDGEPDNVDETSEIESDSESGKRKRKRKRRKSNEQKSDSGQPPPSKEASDSGQHEGDNKSAMYHEESRHMKVKMERLHGHVHESDEEDVSFVKQETLANANTYNTNSMPYPPPIPGPSRDSHMYNQASGSLTINPSQLQELSYQLAASDSVANTSHNNPAHLGLSHSPAMVMPSLPPPANLSQEGTPHHRQSKSEIDVFLQDWNKSITQPSKGPVSEPASKEEVVCPVCEKVFSTSRNLKVHSMIHTGERPHVCQSCGKRFIQKTALNVHIRTHTGDRPYRCEFCDKGFSTRGNLRSHAMVHFRDKI